MRQPESWLRKILIAHNERLRIQNEMLDPENRQQKDGEDSDEAAPVSDDAMARLRTNPRYASLPEIALRGILQGMAGID